MPGNMSKSTQLCQHTAWGVCRPSLVYCSSTSSVLLEEPKGVLKLESKKSPTLRNKLMDVGSLFMNSWVSFWCRTSAIFLFSMNFVCQCEGQTTYSLNRWDIVSLVDGWMGVCLKRTFCFPKMCSDTFCWTEGRMEDVYKEMYWKFDTE